MKDVWIEIRAIFQYETKLVLRQPTWWALVLLFFGIGWLSIDSTAKLPWVTAWKLALVSANALAVGGNLLSPILAIGVYTRELAVGYDWFWVRINNERWGYITKLLVVYALSCMALLPAFLYTAFYMGKYYGMPGLLLQGRTWLFLILPGFGVSLLLTLLISLLTRSPFWALIGVLVIVVGMIFADLDATNLFALTPTKIFFSTIAGFGPLKELLSLNRTFWLVGQLLLLLLALHWVKRAQPRLSKRTTRIWRGGFLLLMAGGIVLVGLVGLAFAQEYERSFYQAGWPPDTRETLSCEELASYESEVHIWPNERTIQGVLRVHTTAPEITLPDGLNPGLSWTTWSVQGSGEIHIDRERATLTLRQSGTEPTTFVMAYQGQPRFPEEFVACRSCNGLKTHTYPFVTGWYLDQETVFLTSDGDWHPFSQCAFDKVVVRLHNQETLCTTGGCVAHNASIWETQSGAMYLEWHQVPPGPLLAAASRYLSREVGNVIVYQPAFLFPQDKQDDILQPYTLAFQQLQQYGLHPDQREPLQIAIIPLIRYPRYSETGVLFVPEPALFMRAGFSEDAFRTFAVEQVVGAWWCSGNVCPEIQYLAPSDIISSFSPPLESDTTENTRLVNTLTRYTALRLITPEGDLASTVPQDIYSGIGTLDGAFFQRLDLLYRQNPASYWEMIHRYRERYGSQAISLEDFEHFVEAVIGAPLPTESADTLGE